MYPLHQTIGHAKASHSSPVVSWQRIYNSLAVTIVYIISSFRRLTPLYSFILLQFSFSFFHTYQLRNSTSHGLQGEHNLCCSQSLFTAPLTSNRSPIVQQVCFCGNVFSNPLPSNEHSADHIENNSCYIYSVVPCAYFGRCLKMGLHVIIYYLV
jgi:hypothetical protein